MYSATKTLDDSSHDGKPESGAPLIARTVLLKAHEAIEYPLPILGGDSRPIVTDGNDNLPGGLAARQRDL